jgi:hypothetical protein
MHVWRKSLRKDIGNYIKSENVENNGERYGIGSGKLGMV